MKVNICGIKHDIIECDDNFDADATHFGQIDYKNGTIKINGDMPDVMKKETICHEMVHGMLIHLGYAKEAEDEQYVQALGNAIMQGFEIKDVEGDAESAEHFWKH